MRKPGQILHVRELLWPAQNCPLNILEAIESPRSDVPYRFGFELLVYSYSPTGLPTPDCAKVVERAI